MSTLTYIAIILTLLTFGSLFFLMCIAGLLIQIKDTDVTKFTHLGVKECDPPNVPEVSTDGTMWGNKRNA